MTIKQTILQGQWQKPIIELSRHDNAGFPIRRLHVPGSEFPYRLEQYREGQTMGKDCPHQVMLLTEETARALGLVIGDDDGQ